MKTIVFASALLLVGGFSQAIAQAPLACDTTGPDQAGEVSAATVINSTVCVAAGGGKWEGQEYHVGTSGQTNNLWDFKGGTDPSNKSEPVGSWANAGNNQFTYNYGGGAVYETLYCQRTSDSSLYFVNNVGRKQNVTFVTAGSGC